MRTWQRPHYLVPNKRWRLALWVMFIAYLVVGIGSVEVNWMRAYEGLDRGAKFLAGFLQPDFTSRAKDIYAGILESLTMTVTSTVVGILLSLPFGVGAARNISPKPVYLFCRSFIALSRSMQEIIVAIFLVALFGFGAFAGFLTLTYATIGFLGKLLAEEIEGIDRKQLEAISATGASWLQRVHMAIWPQVMPRMIGLSFYRFDINFRESAVIGIVGAGGIGATLNTAIDRYEYDSAGAILLIIIVIVMACEYLSGWIRKWVS
ncbi:MAG: phosphonate ABC transporter, permease protein PhnE [Marinomonas foliarum]|jgi:phosphonate transport system permease protein|uniref:Phosphonate ABC transporter, permease protein PhnE n=1 Tax=Marinomonas foliarum TaxID=491950 RepID=A0A369ABQ8_9GAMM|nr:MULTISPECIES: phosphonate ABC transporter, permease protein PhnE [Marinomonas]QRV25580.1 phosphonate ABC transporter, permease protein PhnE [Marinomonas foliarum]RCX06789.1 phosphonate transport system permease protein [Marinomonas foliarum]UTV99463.1 phosphonate ABC transporter, permease protein PhnE [Marinomonas rhizomae]